MLIFFFLSSFKIQSFILYISFDGLATWLLFCFHINCVSNNIVYVFADCAILNSHNRYVVSINKSKTISNVCCVCILIDQVLFRCLIIMANTLTLAVVRLKLTWTQLTSQQSNSFLELAQHKQKKKHQNSHFRY